jgi:hypothetical protein
VTSKVPDAINHAFAGKVITSTASDAMPKVLLEGLPEVGAVAVGTVTEPFKGTCGAHEM